MWTRIAVGLGVALSLIVLIASGARDSATAVVLDVTALGLMCAGAAAPLLGVAVWRGRGRSPRPATFRIASAGLVVALAGAAVLARPPLLRYRSEDLAFKNGDVTLRGTLHLPRRGAPRAAVVLIHGSGCQTRAEHRFYARWLAERGVAALAYDKRGCGASNGALWESDYEDYAADAVAAVHRLKEHPGVAAARVGLVGFSEGEWVAPLAAARAEAVRFVLVIGASGMSPAGQVEAEIALRLRARGHGEAAVEAALALNRELFAYQRTGEGGDRLAALLRDGRQAPWFDDAQDIPAEVYAAEEYAWWRSVMDFDAERAWERVRVPVLLLKGERDDRSPAGEMRRRISRALERGGNAGLETVVYPGADHMLLSWPFGRNTPPPRFAGGFPDVLATWIHRQAAPDADGASGAAGVDHAVEAARLSGSYRWESPPRSRRSICSRPSCGRAGCPSRRSGKRSA